MVQVNWTSSDQKAEWIMKSVHKFKFHLDYEFPVDNIDVKKSHANNARFTDPIRKSHVDELRGRMEAGNVFYPIVVLGATREILSGNHRFMAALALKCKSVAAYVVDKADPKEIYKFVRTINTLEGNSGTDEERVSQAAGFVRDLGMTYQEACVQLFGGRWEDFIRKVENEVRCDHTRNQLLANGVHHEKVDYIVKTIPTILSMLYTLNTIDGNGGVKDPVIQANVFRAVCTHKLGTDDVRKLIAAVKSEGTEKGRQAALAQFTEEYKQAEPAVRHSSDATAFRTGLNKLHNLLCTGKAVGSFSDLEISTAAERKDLLKKMKAVAAVFTKIDRAAKKEKTK